MPKNVSIGVVTSDKMAKTRRVEIPRLVRHPKYGKILRRKAYRDHLLEHKPSRRTRRLGREAEVVGGDLKRVKRMLGR